MRQHVKGPLTRDALAKYGFKGGEHSYGVPIVRWWGEPVKLTIGSYCSLADRIEIFLGGNHRTDWVTTYPFPAFLDWPEVSDMAGPPQSNGDVVIGNDVWIGSAAVILSGVTIGDGAVVGCHSMVTKDVAPYSIVAGSPARQVATRFPPEIVKRLLQLAWWDWPQERLRRYLPMMLSDRIAEFLTMAESEDNESKPEHHLLV
jgi:acetyltransferase-like isoleucine patch superfamily enzyme